MEEESILVIYEPYKEKIYDLLYEEGFREILEDERVHIIIEGVNQEEFSTVYVGLMTDLYENRVCFWQHPYYLNMKQEVIERYHEYIEASRELHKILKNSRERFHKDYHKNIVHGVWNLQQMRTVFELKKAIPTDTLVVLVAAGPSLADAVEVLKEKREKIVIVAVYRVVDYLLEHGIVPDFIATMDPHQKKAEATEEIISKIPMLLPETASIEVWKHHKGIKFMGTFEEYCVELLLNCNIQLNWVSLQSSVAAWQLMIMVALGIEKIALVGQDLAYSGNTSHVGGVKETVNYTGETVKGINGEILASRGDWLVFKKDIENILQAYPDITVYDTKTSGAKIEYTVCEKLDILIDKYGNDNRKLICEKLEKLPCLLEGESLEQYHKELVNSRQNIEKMLEKAQRLVVLAEGICEGKIVEEIEKTNAIQEISEINLWMDKQKEMDIITNFVEAQTMELAKTLLVYSEDEKAEEYNTYMYLQEYYKYIVIGLEDVKQVMDGNL